MQLGTELQAACLQEEEGRKIQEEEGRKNGHDVSQQRVGVGPFPEDTNAQLCASHGRGQHIDGIPLPSIQLILELSPKAGQDALHIGRNHTC